tara:strand:- start:352 stop:585 length:234 start_codon:yes stop_codon:yes gene_type:complete
MSRNLIKTENPNFMKDEETGALVSNDISAFKKYKLELEQKDRIKIQESDLNNIKYEVSELKNELSEIKNMLHQLLTK